MTVSAVSDGLSLLASMVRSGEDFTPTADACLADARAQLRQVAQRLSDWETALRDIANYDAPRQRGGDDPYMAIAVFTKRRAREALGLLPTSAAPDDRAERVGEGPVRDALNPPQEDQSNV